MLDESDRLSLLALIVAVVALIVSAWQLAQQLFATATDGKRFCQGSVMGVWARKTRLSWRWSQIRFETKYTTPEIRMTSGIRDYGTTSTSRPTYSRLMYKIPILGWLSRVLNGPPEDWRDYFEVTTDRPELPLEMQKTVRPRTDPILNSIAEKLSWWKVKAWDRSYHEDSPEIVSWPILLQWIYSSQVNAIRKVEPPTANGKEDDQNDKVDAKQSQVEDQEEHDQVPYRDMLSEEKQLKEDRVVVRLVERSWDLIPPDVVRPLAKSTVGTIIVIAHRLGMSWLGEFNPSEGKMNAAGSGHTITSETVRGLGMVIQYTHHSESIALKNNTGSGRGLGQTEYLSPTSIADKLHCGCLPIDISAIPHHRREREESIPMIDIKRMFDLETVCRRLGIPKADLDALKDSDKQNHQYGSLGRHLKHTMEEAVALLCPIPTLPDCDINARWVVWPFRSFRYPFTPFRQKEGVQELKTLLSAYMDENKPGSDIMRNRSGHLSHLSATPLEHLQVLLKAFPDLRRNRNAPNDIAAAQTARKIFQQVYDIHQETSRVFAELSSSQTSDDEAGGPFLVDMAGAQILLAAKHGPDADKTAHDEGVAQDLSAGETRPRFVQELARLYVKDLTKDLDDVKVKTIRKHLKRSGCMEKLQKGEVPALWWTATVRMVCFFLSVRIRLPETQIPSVWYDSQTPVYIT